MNKTFLLVLIVIIFSSCRVPYEPDIKANEEILVVDAFLTNHAGASYVKLSKAIPYDLDRNWPSVQNATVYLTDGKYNLISFSETSPGYYEPDNAFAGEINVTYKLYVEMPDGDIYVSKPETIPEDMEPASVYGGYDQVEYLTEDAFGKTVKVTEEVCAIYFDYMGETVAPRFRYNSSQLIEYGIPKVIGQFYCWETIIDNNLRFTNEKYTSSSINIYKQEVNTSRPNTNMMVYDIIGGSSPSGWVYSDSLILVYEYRRIVEINQYRMNDDSYEYYKNIKAQSDAEGKLFDPVISQLKGNISCVNISSKTVLGFFETSNLMTMSYVIRQNGVGSNITITRIDNVAPHSPTGFMYNQLPDFWIE
jgi:hypothetical protein